MPDVAGIIAATLASLLPTDDRRALWVSDVLAEHTVKHITNLDLRVGFSH